LPQNFEEVVKEIAPYLKKDQIILDITSLKEKPVKIMHQYFKNNLILGTHPLWGPASKENLKMILTPTNKKEKVFAENFKKWLEAEGIKVILMSPKKQDQLMALVSGLPHFVALVSGSTLKKDFKKIKDVYGSSFEILSSLIKRVVSNSPYLFSELQFSFPKMNEIEDSFEKKVKFWREIIKKKDRKKFVQEMLKIRRSIKSLI
jgi:prephenate dehydrogenase